MNVSAVLESWEGGIQQSNRTLRAWLNRNKWVLGGALLLAMGLYYPIFQLGLENIDSFCTAEPYWADLWEKIPYWETTQGRWALRWNDALLDGMHPYFLTVLLASVFFLLGAVLLDPLCLGIFGGLQPVCHEYPDLPLLQRSLCSILFSGHLGCFTGKSDL